MSVTVLNWFDLVWEEDLSGGSRFASRSAPLATSLGARKLGYHAEILAPGKASVPYHSHLVNEEMFLVLGGEMSVRLDGAEHVLGPGDVVAIPPGPDGAHQFLNRSGRPAHFFAASTRIPREVVDYPDSGKRAYGVGGLTGERDAVRAMVRGERLAAYFDGEPVDEPLGEAPPTPASRDPRIVNLDRIPWTSYARGPFGGERKLIGRAAGARLLGYSLYRLAPGQRPWPFHFHHVNEEFFYVRTGHGRLRTADGERALKPGDAFASPPGPDGAHAILNSGDGALEYLALSTMEEPEISEYPDSGKVYVMVGSGPGGSTEERRVDAAFRLADAVDYLEGER